MAKGVYLLTVSSGFCASHCLRGYQGPCEALHGHNFSVTVEVRGESLAQDTHILMDFKELKARLGEVLAPLDHAHLNDIPPFTRENPSSENLAAHIYREMAARLAGSAVRVSRVSVSEKETSIATYYEIE